MVWKRISTKIWKIREAVKLPPAAILIIPEVTSYTWHSNVSCKLGWTNLVFVVVFYFSTFSASVVSADKPDNNEDSQANLKQQMLTLEDKENWCESYLTAQCLFDSLRTVWVSYLCYLWTHIIAIYQGSTKTMTRETRKI